MTARTRDPLLHWTRLLLHLVTVFAMLAAVASVLAIPASWIFRDAIVVKGAPATTGFLVGASALMVFFVAITTCAVLFLRQLVAVIDTVAHGTPFSRDNARRLRTMAWLALGVQGVSLLAAPLAGWIESLYPDARFSVHVDFGGVLIALLLFVLARVFDTGARLAEDVEGTV